MRHRQANKHACLVTPHHINTNTPTPTPLPGHLTPVRVLIRSRERGSAWGLSLWSEWATENWLSLSDSHDSTHTAGSMRDLFVLTTGKRESRKHGVIVSGPLGRGFHFPVA